LFLRILTALANSRRVIEERAMIGKMAIAAALPGFNDLGRSVTPNFLSRNRF